MLRNNCNFLFAKTTLTLNEVEKEIICCTFVNFQETTERLSFFSSTKISLRLLLSFVRLLFCSLWLYPLFCILKPRHPSIKTSTAVVRYFPKLSLFFFFFFWIIHAKITTFRSKVFTVLLFSFFGLHKSFNMTPS